MARQPHQTQNAPPATIAEFRRLVGDIQTVLASASDPPVEAVEDLHGRYAQAIDALNARLERCDDLLSNGYRSEAIQEGEREPELLEAVSILDFSEATLWIDYAEQFDLPMPRPLMVGVAADLNDAYDTDQAVEGLLNRYRVYNLARCPLDRRIRLLRKIARQDAGNPIWHDDLKTFERARHKQIRDEIKVAAESRDTDALSRLEMELVNSPWTVTPSAETVKLVRQLHTRIRVEDARNELKALEPELTNAYSELNVDAGRRLRHRWHALEKLAGGVDNELAELVAPTLDWLAEEDQRDADDRQFKEAVAGLEAALEGDADRPTLEQHVRQATRHGRNLPDAVDKHYRQRIHDLELAASRKRRLVVGASFVGLLTVAAGIVWGVQSVQYANSVEQHASNLREFIENEHLDAAQKYADDLQENEPAIAAEPELKKLLRDLAAERRADGDRKDRLAQILNGAEQSAIGENTWKGFETAFTQLKEARTLCKSDAEVARVKEVELRIRRAEQTKQKTVDDGFLAELERVAAVEQQLEKNDLEGAKGALEQARKLESREHVNEEIKNSGKLALLLTRLEGRVETAGRLREMARSLRRITDRIDDPVRFAEALREYAAKYPSERRSVSFEAVAQRQQTWSALRSWNGLVERWAREDLTRLTPEDAAAKLKSAERVFAAAGKLSCAARLKPALRYLKTIQARKGNAGSLLAPLRKTLTDRRVDIKWLQLKNGRRYYIKTAPFDEKPSAMVAGARIDYYVDLALNTKNARVAVTEISNPSKGKTFDWTSPQAAFSRAALAQLKQLDRQGWELTFAGIHRELLNSKMDPVLKLQLLQQLLSIASAGSSLLDDALAGQRNALNAAAVDTTVNWLAPEDEAAETERERAAKVLKTLKPLKVSAVTSALRAMARPDLGPRYTWVGWLHRDENKNWVCATRPSLNGRLSGTLHVLLPNSSGTVVTPTSIGGLNQRRVTLNANLASNCVEGMPVFLVPR